ncbi:MAG: SpoIIE family protein phosphatase [Tabrizicola sp.]|uniref:PP2C family protein-serine/threonine phosphatase n=1 Tax=Tabrizicola sp. TaxID=2005166 RepID=UPI002ABA6BBE|nr:SpoIIE family protein phosphatase [Tabrizicola sp.]MDZ4087726.1 SpoIIE family protein phosphatase [Tabrizicola sp.]
MKVEDGMQAVEVPRHVLVVDDSRAQRHMVSMQLRRWGYRVSESESALAALDLCRSADIDIIISDWMMPGMTGLEFCRQFRALGRESYGYFVLLTSKSETTEIADGLEAGADDFLTKPVASNELRARLRAGERMLAMQAELLAKNRVIVSTLVELQKIYDSLDRDLIEARKLQQTLIRDRVRDYGWAKASLILRNSGRVGGDLVGSFRVDPDRVVVYSIDVSGHGVASAMMTARLAGFLTGSSPEQNLAFQTGPEGEHILLPPAAVVDRFNRLMLDEIQAEQYFTMVLAVVDRATGRLDLVQAGHPHPMLIRRDGRVHRLGHGGMPVGLIDSATYDQITVQIAPGDRLILVSDGFTECPLPEGRDFGEDGLVESLQASAHLSGLDLLEAMVWDLTAKAGTDSFPDDVSGIVLDLLE